jgi:hypothetical protein
MGKRTVNFGCWSISPTTASKKPPFYFRIFTSNCISRLFWFGTDGVGILKMAQQIFKKEQKQRRCSYAAPPAAEAKGVNLKEQAKLIIVN